MAYIPHGRLNGKMGEVNTKVYLRSQMVLDTINEYFETTTDMLIKKSRKREIVWPRQVAMYFMANYTVMSLKAIGLILGDKEHTTVTHAIETVNDLQRSDILVKEQIMVLTKKFDAQVEIERRNKIGTI